MVFLIQKYSTFIGVRKVRVSTVASTVE